MIIVKMRYVLMAMWLLVFYEAVHVGGKYVQHWMLHEEPAMTCAEFFNDEMEEMNEIIEALKYAKRVEDNKVDVRRKK